MGGASSSGTTLIREVLNRHSFIFSGEELNFFNKSTLFENWQKDKLKIIPIFPFYSTFGWTTYRRSNLAQPEYGWELNGVIKLLKESNSIVEFTNQYYTKALEFNNKSKWIEKTPSNCYSFKNFLNHFPDGKVIHVVRNPFDNAASLFKNRKQTILSATSTWLYNNAIALNVMNDPRYYRIKYEDFVENPEEELKKLLNFLCIPFEKDILLQTKDNHQKLNTHGWNNAPSGKISKSSVNNFSKLDLKIQQQIKSAFSIIKISDYHQNKFNIPNTEFNSLCKEFGYDIMLIKDETFKHELKILRLKDLILRSLKFYKTGFFKYPISIK